MKRICPGVYELEMIVQVEFQDGTTKTLPAKAEVVRVEEWGKNCWAIDLTAKDGEREIDLTSHDDVYYSKKDALDSLQTSLRSWIRSEYGWTLNCPATI